MQKTGIMTWDKTGDELNWTGLSYTDPFQDEEDEGHHHGIMGEKGQSYIQSYIQNPTWLNELEHKKVKKWVKREYSKYLGTIILRQNNIDPQ